MHESLGQDSHESNKDSFVWESFANLWGRDSCEFLWRGQEFFDLCESNKDSFF